MKTHIPLLLFFCFIFGTLKIYAQEQMDNSAKIIYATSMHDLGYKYLSSNDFKTALEYTQKAVNLRRELLGENNLDYIKSLHNLATCHARLGDYKKAVILEENVCTLIKDTISWNELYAVATHLLGQYYYGVGETSKAIEIGRKACKMCKDILGETHNEYAASLSSLAYYYMNIAQWEDVLTLEEMALKIHKQNNHLIGIANSNMNIGIVKFNNNDYISAIEKLEYAGEVFKQIRNPGYYSVLGTLILCYNKIGNHTKAILLGEEALNGFKEIFGERSHQYATTLGNLSESYMYIGNFEKYAQYTTLALEIQEEIFGSNHHMYALALGNAAFMYGTYINVKEALEMNQKAIDIFVANNMTNTVNYQMAINNQIQFNISLGNYQEAINDINSILPTIDTNSIIYADYLFKLSVCYNSIDNFEYAIKYNRESLNIIKGIYGKNHISYIGGLEHQTSNLLFGGTEEQLIENLQEEAESIALFTQNNVLTYSRRERQMWWQDIDKFYQDLGNWAFTVKKPKEIKNILYNGMLISKGILLNIDKEIQKTIQESDEKQIYEELKSYREHLANKLQTGNLHNDYDLQNNIALLERELLYKINKQFNLDNYDITVDSIKACLGEKDIAIEFYNYPFWQFETDSIIYGALVIRKDWQEPTFVALKKKSIIQYHHNNRKDSVMNISNNSPLAHYLSLPITSNNKNELYQCIWSNLVTNQLIKPGDNIYFSASGILHQIPIESLPIGDGKIMSDVYNMHRLSSTRELVKEKKEMKYTKAALYGGLNYDMTDSELLAENQTYSKNATEEYFVSRGCWKIPSEVINGII